MQEKFRFPHGGKQSTVCHSAVHTLIYKKSSSDSEASNTSQMCRMSVSCLVVRDS